MTRALNPTQVRLRRMLAASVARMQRPMLVAVLSRWKHSWGEAEKRAGRLSGMSQVASPDLDAEPKPILHTDPFAGSTWALTVPYTPNPEPCAGPNP